MEETKHYLVLEENGINLGETHYDKDDVFQSVPSLMEAFINLGAVKDLTEDYLPTEDSEPIEFIEHPDPAVNESLEEEDSIEPDTNDPSQYPADGYDASER